MSDTPPPAQPQKAEPIQLGEPGEHALSVLLFSWMRTDRFARFFLGCVAAACAALFAGDLLLARRGPPSIESLPGFMGAFGFAAFALAVLSGWPLGRLLRRTKDYGDSLPGKKPAPEGGPDG